MSSSESSGSFDSEAADSRPKGAKEKARAPRAVLHINPSSWQPVLLFALVEESKEHHLTAQNNGLSPERAITDYLLSDRGWRLLEVLSQTHWKDTEVPGLSKHELLGLLSTLFLSLDWLNSEREVKFTEWDFLLVPESKLLEVKESKKILAPLGPEKSGPLKPTKKQPKKPRYWDIVDDWEYRESHERELNMEEDKTTSTEETLDPDHHKKATGGKAPPYILQEDSDGFPLCWNEDAPLPGFEGGKLWLDDMILDMLHYQLDPKKETRSETGAAIMVLALMKKTVACFMSHPDFSDETERDKFCTSTAEFVTKSLKWSPADIMVLEPKETDYDSRAVSTFLRSLLMSRHWADTVMAVVTALGIIRKLRQDLKHDPSKFSSKKKAALDGAMEFLLESGHRLAVGLPCTVDASLQMFPGVQLADHLQVAGQILGVFSEGQYLESLRDLAIAMDLLAQVIGITHKLDELFVKHQVQVNYKPQRSRLYSESTTVGAVSKYMDNAYQSRLYCLLLSVASLSSRIQEAKTLWLHCSVCRRTSHDRCPLNLTPMVGHHHGILEFPEHPSATPGFVPLENRTREEISDRCACAYLIRWLEI